MTKSLIDALGVKDVSEMSADEISELINDAPDEDTKDDLIHARNNAIANEILELLFNRNIHPADAVDISVICAVKMVIGNSKTIKGCGETASAVINRLLALLAQNLPQIGNEASLHTFRKKRDIQ